MATINSNGIQYTVKPYFDGGYELKYDGRVSFLRIHDHPKRGLEWLIYSGAADIDYTTVQSIGRDIEHQRLISA